MVATRITDMRRAHNHETLHSGESSSSMHTIFLSYYAKGYVGGLLALRTKGTTYVLRKA